MCFHRRSLTAHWNSSSELRSIVFSVYAKRDGGTPGPLLGWPGTVAECPVAGGCAAAVEKEDVAAAAELWGAAACVGAALEVDGAWCRVGVVR